MNKAIVNLLKMQLKTADVKIDRRPGGDYASVSANGKQLFNLTNSWDYGDYAITIFSTPKIEKRVHVTVHEEDKGTANPEDIELRNIIVDLVRAALRRYDEQKEQKRSLDLSEGLSPEDLAILKFLNDKTI
jgi:hypothetical protein